MNPEAAESLAGSKVEQRTSTIERSMLEQAARLHDRLRKLDPADRGKDNLTFLQRPYAYVQTDDTVAHAPVWFTAYMPSIIGLEDDGEMARPLETLCSLELWQHFAELGVTAVHTGPVMKAGGSTADGKPYKSIDGWFDPIALEIDPDLGSERDYSRLVWIAENMPSPQTGNKLDGVVIGDIVPGHTGLGADFLLALQGVGHYPGLYVLTRVDQVLDGKDRRSRHIPEHVLASLRQDISTGAGGQGAPLEVSRLLSVEEVNALTDAKVIPGRPQRAMGAQAGYGWSISREFSGEPDADGNTRRRWIYLHFFHPKQPTLNFFDPGYAAWRMTTGQLNYVMWELRSTGVRLDANAFLGIEPHRKTIAKQGVDNAEAQSESGTWSEAHPLSQAVTNMLAWQARRLGGFSFQEMNMAIPEIAKSGLFGPDLAYDFITRPACEHAVLTGDTGLLLFMYREMQRFGISPSFLVHALQNHDELTYELVHLKYLEELATANGAAPVTFLKTAATVRAEMRRAALHRLSDSPEELEQRRVTDFYNKESPNGLCTTIAGLLAAKLGCDTLDEALLQKDSIMQGHLLLAAFNALQPGVFAFSGWDLVGALPVEEARLPSVLLNAGALPKSDLQRDYRWVNRGAYRLLSSFGSQSAGENKRFGCLDLPEAQALYGPLDRQKSLPDSFLLRLQHILALRRIFKIHLGKWLGPLDNLPPGVFGMQMSVQPYTDDDAMTLTALFNFSPPGSMPVQVNDAMLRGVDIGVHVLRDLSKIDTRSEDRVGTVLDEESPLTIESWQWRLLRYE